MAKNKILLTDLIDLDTLQRIQDAFSKMTGVASIITDADGKPVSNGTDFCDFCWKYTRSSELGASRCQECAKRGVQLAFDKGTPQFYRCHTGLIDFSAPIIVNEQLVGSFMGGQILADEPDYTKIEQLAKDFGIEPEEYVQAVKQVKRISKERYENIINALTDITAILSSIANNNYKLRLATDEIEKAANMKSDFLANMSHEIRTPMNAVIGMAEMALRENLTPAARDYIQQIKSSGKSLLTIINDILDFSKIESGKLDIIFAEYDTMSLVNDIANIINTRIGNKDVKLIIDVNPTFPKMLMGDNIRIKQIILNLANNAVKFTKEGQVIIKLDYLKKSEFELELFGSVEDTGIGIKEEDMDKIFQSFQQVDSKRNRNIEGTGLGLAITKNLLSLMYGTIMVQSVYGKGSKFSFTLQQRIVSSASACEIPNADTIYSAGLLVNAYQRSQLYRDAKRLGVYYKELKSESELEEQAEAGLQFLFLDTTTFTPSVEDFVRNHPDITTIILIPFNKKLDTNLPNIKVVHEPLYAWNLAMIFRGESLHSLSISGDDMDLDFVAPDANILIVDDNAINLTVAEGLLKPLQMKIDTALSGKEAIEKISEKQYDMIFMDHMMPELDGVETTHIIRRMHPEYDMVPIIALTANVVEETRFMFLSEGMNDFVAKPIELRMIISVIKRWLPSEKLKPLSEADLLPETTQSTAPSSQTSLEIGDLDTASALQLLGSEDLLWMVLKDYYTVIDKKIALIKNYQLNEEWKNYTTEVHALKSASKQIGAMELSEKAAALEKAGNDLNIEMIQERTDDMLEQYRGYQELLAPYFTEEKEETDSSDLPDIDKDLLKEILHTLSDAVTNLDLDQLEQSVQELSNYALEETHAALFKKLKTAVEELDFEACDSVLLDWITLL